MKWTKLAVAIASAFAFGNAYAFHDGGAAECDGCHVMHNASNGTAATTINNKRNNLGNSYLLQGTDQSSTCLNCHNNAKPGSYHVANLDTTVGIKGNATKANYNPGGDFAWLTVGFSWVPYPGGSATSPGERHGHNVVAADFGLIADSTLTTAPGGTFQYGTGKAAFACSSCHDPHGRYRLSGTSATSYSIVGGGGPEANMGSQIDPIVGSGSYGAAPASGQAVGVYRLLAGKGYAPVSNPAFPFGNDPPIAVAPSTYNAVESGAAEIRVAYGTGMSEWCQNCHTNIHLDAYVTGAAGLRHPAGSGAKFRQIQADIYNAYVGSGNLAGTNVYTSLVPFESGNTDLSKLATASQTATGVDANGLLIASTSSNVMCLSCHRAHASGFDSMVRWDMGNAFITEGTAFVDGWEGKSAAQQQAAYYGRNMGNGFQAFQRTLCNKCHAKD